MTYRGFRGEVTHHKSKEEIASDEIFVQNLSDPFYIEALKELNEEYSAGQVTIPSLMDPTCAAQPLEGEEQEVPTHTVTYKGMNFIVNAPPNEKAAEILAPVVEAFQEPLNNGILLHLQGNSFTQEIIPFHQAVASKHSLAASRAMIEDLSTQFKEIHNIFVEPRIDGKVRVEVVLSLPLRPEDEYKYELSSYSFLLSNELFSSKEWREYLTAFIEKKIKETQEANEVCSYGTFTPLYRTASGGPG